MSSSSSHKRKAMSSTPAMPVKKRAATSLTLSDVALPATPPVQATTPLNGVPFRKALDKVSQDGHGTVQLKASFPGRYKSEGTAKTLSQSINAVYQPKEQVRTSSSNTWTQGMLTNFGSETVWKDILPSTLDTDSAQKHGRAIKATMGHPVKESDLGNFTAPNTRKITRGDNAGKTSNLSPSQKHAHNEAQAKRQANNFISPAATSFVEDLTGASAVNTAFTGSAVRASFLRAKLLLDNDPSTRGKDDKALLRNFNGYLLQNLPQLKKDGASNLADTVTRELGSGNSSTADNYQQQVLKLHTQLDKAIGHTFDRKRAAVQAKWEKYTGPKSMSDRDAGNRIAQKFGDWWGKAAKAGTLDHVDAPVDYADHKRAKYGVGKIPT
ncbi:hypothetical protein N8I74_09700 [Chitiniphilus purpureus]|uniref:Uncharacterized protein n=1 Tax=Chitiniphilus purpureus TaxID=2981137 RepID=A0ABY6DSA6_9NEIS|nr:hypothetical protein [Chitiniphilus sp. CD1]UXY17260.1 hypothetical protein N8I74_09700 [Chitiniphilus sp. CD1]